MSNHVLSMRFPLKDFHFDFQVNFNITVAGFKPICSTLFLLLALQVYVRGINTNRT